MGSGRIDPAPAPSYSPAMTGGSNYRGIAAMIASAATFVANDSCMKLAMADLPPFEVLMMRGISGALACLPVLLLLGLGPQLKTGLNRWVLLRAASECIAVLVFVLALKRMPIGDLTAIGQTAPLFIILASALIWRERVGAMRWTLIALGFAGAVLVAQPGGASAPSIAPLALLVALFSAGRDILTRKVPPHVPALVASFITIVVVMTAAALSTASFETWVMPSRGHVLLMAAAGPLMLCGHFFIMQAYRLASAVVVAPFAYTFTLWAMVSGAVLFGTVPNMMGQCGIGLIVVCGVAVVMLDERQRRREVAAVAGA